MPTDHVANQAEAAALDNLAGEPTGNDAHKQNNQETFASDVHWRNLCRCLVRPTHRGNSRPSTTGPVSEGFQPGVI